jgi:hypothetical protein
MKVYGVMEGVWRLGKVNYTGHQAQREYKYSSALSLTSALDVGGWSTPGPVRFTPGKDLVPNV